MKATLTKSDIIEYLKQKKIFKDFTVRELSAGLANRNYLIKSNDGLFNLRTNRLRPPLNSDSLRNEHLALEFLAKKNIPFTSRSYFFDPKENIHIVAFVPGRKIHIKNIDIKHLKIVLECLYRINRLASEFKQFLKKKKIKFAGPKRYNQALAKRLASKMEWLKQDKLYHDIINWVEERFKYDLESLQVEEKETYLNHGDPVNNIIINGRKLYLIDWELVSFAYDPGLANIYTHGFVSRERKKDLISIYADLAKMDKEWLRNQVLKKYKQMLLEHIILLCRIHARNRRLYSNPSPLDIGFIKDRQENYLKTKIYHKGKRVL